MMKAVVSVLGKDKKGIIAQVSTELYKNSINIVDISQTIMQNDFFAMVMMVELPKNQNIEEINSALQEVAKRVEVEIRIQHEDIFNSMHKL